MPKTRSRDSRNRNNSRNRISRDRSNSRRKSARHRNYSKVKKGWNVPRSIRERASEIKWEKFRKFDVSRSKWEVSDKKSIQNHPETSGERAVKAELEFLGINFEQEKRINGLVGDSKSYRVADFFLPNHGIFIEYLGSWGSKKDTQFHKQRYLEKIDVYNKNKVPCIYVFPKHHTGLAYYLKSELKKYGVQVGRYNFKVKEASSSIHVKDIGSSKSFVKKVVGFLFG